MKTLKKSLALVLALMMVVSMLAVGAGAAYTDVDEITPEYKEAIDVLSAFEVIGGIGDGSLAPKAGIERAQLAKIMYEAYTGKTYDKAASYAGMDTFTDVDADEWYAGVVNYAAFKGWIKGYGDGKFGPKDAVTGYDALTMLFRMIGFGKFDELAGDVYRGNIVEEAEKKNVLVNTDEVGVDYSKAATREEVFEYLYQLLNVNAYVVESTTSLTYKTSGEDVVPLKASSRFDNFAVNYAPAIVTNVPANTVECYVAATEDAEEEFYVGLYGELVATVEEFGPEYLGHVVKATILTTTEVVEGVEVETETVIALEILSEVIYVEEDLVIDEDNDEADFEKLDDFYADLASTDVICGLVAGEVFAVEDDEQPNTETTIVDGYYTVLPKDAAGNDKAYLVCYEPVETVVVLDTLTVATEEEDENNLGDVDYTFTTLNIFNVEYDAQDEEGTDFFALVDGIEGLADGTYAVAIYPFGHYATVEVLEVEAIYSVDSVKKASGEVVSFKVDGAEYEVLDAETLEGFFVGDFITTEEFKITGTVPANEDGLAIGALVHFAGKVISVDVETYTEEEAPEAETNYEFDGFAQILDAEIKLKNGSSSSSIMGSVTAAPEVEYAKVKVLTDAGEEKIYDIDAAFVEDEETEEYELVLTWNADDELEFTLDQVFGAEDDLETPEDEEVIGLVNGLVADEDGYYTIGWTVIGAMDLEDVYAYALDGDVISFYTLDAASDVEEDPATYAYFDVALVGAVSKNQTTVEVDEVDLVIRDTKFIAKQVESELEEDEEAVWEALSGTASFETFAANSVAVVKAVLVDEETSEYEYEVLVVFGTEYNEVVVDPAEATETYVYVDKDDTAVDGTGTDAVTTYATYGADGVVVYREADTGVIAADGLYKLNDDGTIDNVDIEELAENNIKLLSNTYVKLGDTYVDYTAADIVLIGEGAEFKAGANILYVLDDGALVTVWVIA